MKKVLHFRLDAPQYSSEGIRKAFIDLGYEYVGMNWQQVKFDEGILGLQARMIQSAAALQPDIIFLHIQNPEVIDIETCEELSKHGTTVFYTFDVREDIQWIVDLLPYINIACFADQESVDHCKGLGFENCFVVQSSIDMELYSKIENQPITKDIVFIGSNYVNTNLGFPLAQERLEMVNFLRAEYGNDFMVRGMNWPISESLNAYKEREIYSTSKIAINHNNFYREGYTSDRLWRIMACGCFCLTKYFPGIESLFEKEVTIDWWENFDELNSLIKYYLSNDKERESIALAGQQHVQKNHSWKNRIQELETIIEHHGRKAEKVR